MIYEYDKPEQKLISFTNSPVDLKKISEDMKNGWAIVSLAKNGIYYLGIMEFHPDYYKKEHKSFIFPKKKFKISM